jgi:N-methylhydantoinase B
MPGEWVLGVESGGGGYGNPLDRDPERVREDVLEGWVSGAQALETYGVVIGGKAEDESLVVHRDETERRRAEMRGAGEVSQP